MAKELKRSAEVVDLSQVFTLLANEKDFSAVALVAGFTRSSLKIITVLGISATVELGKDLQ